MWVKAKKLVEILKKIDEVEDKAGIAFSSSSTEDLQIALERMREVRKIAYEILENSDWDKEE